MEINLACGRLCLCVMITKGYEGLVVLDTYQEGATHRLPLLESMKPGVRTVVRNPLTLKRVGPPISANVSRLICASNSSSARPRSRPA